MTDTTFGGSNLGRSTEAATSGVGKARQQASELAEKATDKVDSARQPIADKLHGAASAIRDQAHSMASGEGVTGIAHSAADKLESSATYIESHDAKAMVQDLVAVVKRHPTQALLLAGALGFLVARAFRAD